MRVEVGQRPRKTLTTSLTANKQNDWLSDESIAAFMAEVEAPEAILV